MRFLLDTHFLLWIPIDDRRLTTGARALLADPNNQFVFSAVNLWEMALKRMREHSDFPYNPRSIRSRMLANGYEELAMTGDHAIHVDSLPSIHKDPFDRLLIAQAIVEGITLLTSDKTIAKYPGPIRRV